MEPCLEPGQNVVVHENRDVVDFANETVLLSLGKETLTVALTSLSEKKLDFAPGKAVYVTFVRPDALYQFATVVVAADESRDILTLRRDDGAITRIQRRSHFRLPVRFPVSTRRFVRPEGKRKIEVEREAEALDLSGSGVLLRLDEPYQKDDLVELTLFLPDGGSPVVATGRVVRVERYESGEGIGFRCGLEFVMIRESDRSRIVRYLFLTQARRGV
ncbi:MAG: PilZ domain-containing protein [candidate division KSB1 bacterium]|nr:PilZ domain-containing protein [candidate division KSB1 bacterium]